MASPLFDEIYAVGDSLSDSGGIFGLSSQALDTLHDAHIDTTGLHPIPADPYFMGRFSNGPVLPEITAQLLGATLHNFSFGGAEAIGTLTFFDVAVTAFPSIAAFPPEVRALIAPVLDRNISLSGQLADFVAATEEHPPSADSALVSLIGLNDLRALAANFDPADPLDWISLAQVVGGIVRANLDVAETAFDHGIGTVIFETLPAASFFPIANQLSPELQAIGDAAVDAVNLGLQADALALRLGGHDARVVDLARMADEISADPGTFGFRSLDQPTLLGNGIVVLGPNLNAPPPEQTAFFDFIHPTTNLHGVLAVFAAESLSSHTVFRGGGNDFINGSPGDDLVLAGDGNDQAWLGGGDDVLLGGLGNDLAHGGRGSDLIAGGAGNDRLSGSGGSDVLAGNAGDDTLNGGSGNDALIDGLGSDRLAGGAGNDLFFATQAQLLGGSGTDTDHFDGGGGFDTLAVLLDPANPATLSSMHLTTTGIERIVFTTQFGFTDVPRPGGDLGERLHQADLFGLV
jgi:Ca2+-binding RTX toxin-like protein